MTRGLLDTNMLILRATAAAVRLEDLPSQLFLSVVTIGELELGVHVARDPRTRQLRLETLRAATARPPLPIDAHVASQWARPVTAVRGAGRKAGVNDLWIAATALAHDMPVVTRDRDFDVLRDLGLADVIVV